MRRWLRWLKGAWLPLLPRPPLYTVTACLCFVLMLSACPALASAMTRAQVPPKTAPPKTVPPKAPSTAAPTRPAPPSARAGVKVPTAAATAATAAISAIVQEYFAALNRRDVEAAFALWSQASPEFGPVRQAMPVMLERVRPEWTGIWTRPMSVEQDRALARVHYSLTRTFQMPGREAASASAPEALRSVLAFVREKGVWRITSEKPEGQYLAEQLLNARDDAGVRRIVSEERDAITLSVIRILMGISSNSAAGGNHDLAVRGYERAVRLAEAPVATLTDLERQNNMADLHLAGALLGLAGVLNYRPQPDPVRAIDLYTRAIALYEKAAADAGVSDALQGLANAYYSAGDYASALQRYQQVLPIVTKQQDQAAFARAQTGIGNVQYLFGQYDPALAAYEQALATYRAIGDVDNRPRVLEGLGRVYAAVGDFAQSRERYQFALRLLSRTTNKSEQASVQLALASLSFQEGQFEDAKALDEQALKAAASVQDRVTEGRALFALGLVHAVQGELARAVEKYTEAHATFMSSIPQPNVDSAGQALIARGFTRVDQRDFVRALEDFTASVPLFEKTRNREGLARAHLGLATTHVRRVDAKAALLAAGRAKELAERSLSLDLLWQTHLESGRASLLANDALRARQNFEEAIRVLEGARFEVGGEAEGQPPAQRVAPYVALAEWHIARNDATQAFIVAEAGKRRLLEDLLRPFRFRMTRGLTPERQADERRLVSLRTSLLRQMRRERDLATPNATRLAALEQAMAAARAESVEWNRAVARDAPSVVYLRGEASFPSLDALDAVLPARTALVHFIVGDERTSVIVATRRGEVGAASGASSDERRERVGSAPASASPPAASAPAPAAAPTSAPTTPASAPATLAASNAASPGGALPSGASPSGAPTTGASASGVSIGVAPAARVSASGASSTGSSAEGASPAAALANTDPPMTLATIPAPEHVITGTSGGLDLFAYTIPVTRKQLADQVWRFTEGIAAKADTVAADARTLHALLLAPAAETLAGRSALVVVPDDLLWGLPFEALMPADDRYLIEQSAITLMPSSAAWLSRPQQAPARPLIAWPASGELSDVSPLQARVTMAASAVPPTRPDSVSSPLGAQTSAQVSAQTQASAQTASSSSPASSSPASPAGEATVEVTTTIAAWELFDRDLATEDLLAVDIRPKTERLRLDAGRLGATGFFWAAQSAGARRVIVARRPPPSDVPTVTAAPLPHPHDWATWLVIGPPEGAAATQPQPQLQP